MASSKLPKHIPKSGKEGVRIVIAVAIFFDKARKTNYFMIFSLPSLSLSHTHTHTLSLSLSPWVGVWKQTEWEGMLTEGREEAFNQNDYNGFWYLEIEKNYSERKNWKTNR